MKRFLTSVSLQHEPKARDVITLVKKTFFRTSIVRNFISRGVKMRISARDACVKPHLRTRSDIKIFICNVRNTRWGLILRWCEMVMKPLQCEIDNWNFSQIFSVTLRRTKFERSGCSSSENKTNYLENNSQLRASIKTIELVNKNKNAFENKL